MEIFLVCDANLAMEVATIFPGTYHYHLEQSMLKDIVQSTKVSCRMIKWAMVMAA